MKFVEYPDRDLLLFDLADMLASELVVALSHHDTVSFCVPGGTTPGPVFDVLSAVKLDWSRVTVFPSDERWVPESDERSNGRLLRQRLLTGRAAAASYIPLYNGAPAPEDAAKAISDRLAPHLPISVLLLGMGADMHTASLFPGGDRLAEALEDDAPIAVPMRAPAAPEPRMTLSAPVLAGAMACHVLIFGSEKRRAFEHAQSLPPEEAPIRAVLSNATVHWAE